MLDLVFDFGQTGAALLIGIATGAAWIMVIVGPNVSYDRLDQGRADAHVRALLQSGSDPIAVLLLASAALAILGGALVAGVCAGLAAFGFFSNRLLLASFKRGEVPKGARSNKKGQRAMAVGMSLLFTLVSAIAGLLCVLGF